MKSNNNERKPHCTNWKSQESSFLIISGHSHSPFLFREREPIHHGDVNAPLILSRPCFLIDQASSEYIGALERREADTPEQTSLTPHETKKEHNLPTAQLNNTTTLPTKDTAIQIPSSNLIATSTTRLPSLDSRLLNAASSTHRWHRSPPSTRSCSNHCGNCDVTGLGDALFACATMHHSKPNPRWKSTHPTF